MKKLTCFTAFLAATVSVHAQELRVTTPLHPEGAKVTIYREWPVRRLIDTPPVRQGAIQIQLPDSGAAVYTVSLRKPYVNVTLFSSATPVSVTIGKDTQAIVKGGPVLEKLNVFEQSMKPVEAVWSKLGTQYGNTADLDAKLAISEEMNKMATEVQAKRLAFALENTGNLAGAWSAYHYAFAWTGASLSKLIPSFRQQDWAAATTQKLIEKQAESDKINMTGKTAPSFALRSLNGKVVDLGSLVAGNKYVLLDVWASWCTPCRAGNRKLAPHYAALKKKGIEIVSVSVDEKDELWRKAVASDNIPWPQLVAPEGMKSDIVAKYKVKSLPATFLINKEGKIIQQHVEISDLEKLP